MNTVITECTEGVWLQMLVPQLATLACEYGLDTWVEGDYAALMVVWDSVCKLN